MAELCICRKNHQVCMDTGLGASAIAEGTDAKHCDSHIIISHQPDQGWDCKPVCFPCLHHLIDGIIQYVCCICLYTIICKLLHPGSSHVWLHLHRACLTAANS